MNRLLPFIFLLHTLPAFSQTDYLFIKKGGKKKRTYTEGSNIDFRLVDGNRINGVITRLRNDTIYINGMGVPRKDVAAVILHERKKKPFPADVKTMLAIGVGVGLTTVGLSLNNANKPWTAFVAAMVIGYGPLLVKHLFSRLMYTIYRKKFRIRNKYRLQVLDFYIPKNKAF